MIAFLSGPISGHRFYRLRFWIAALFLRFKGYKVHNPAILPGWLTHDQAMHICYAMIDRSDMLVQLDGWRHSEGAMLEAEYARARDIPIVEIRDLISNHVSSKRNTTQDNSMQP